MPTKIPTDFPYASRYIDVYGSKMHYIEQGHGDPILFLHGMPTSCYLWRNVIPHLSTLGRCIAIDLIGMGKSDKPDIEYTIFEHIKYVEKFIETLGLGRVTLVMHGWGSIIGFDYAMRHEKNCKGLVFYEAFLRPFNGEGLSLPLQEQIFELQEDESIYEPQMNGIYFVDKVLPQGMLRSLSETEMNYYREPFRKEGSAKALIEYFQELVTNEKKNKVDKLIEDYSKKLIKSKLPKLMLYSIPGFITTIATVMWAKENLFNLEMIDVGESLHYAQETNPVLMGESISIWLQAVEQHVA